MIVDAITSIIVNFKCNDNVNEGGNDCFENQIINRLNNDNNWKRWVVVDIEFFDFHYDGKIVVIASAVEHVEKNMYFRNIYVFMKRIKDIIIVKNSELIRNNLYTCFKEIALKWYISTLIKEIKFYVKHDDDFNHWLKTFLKRWKKFFSTVLIIVMKEKYTLDDARCKRKSNEFVQIIIWVVRSVNMIIEQQIFLIYNVIDSEFRRDLVKIIDQTNLNFFFTELKNMKKIWWIIEFRHREANGYLISIIDNQRSDSFNCFNEF